MTEHTQGNPARTNINRSDLSIELDRFTEIEQRLWFILDALCADDLTWLGIEPESAQRLYYTLESIAIDLRSHTDALKGMV